MQLYGFIAEDERTMFRQLQSISGIGARIALNILSGCGTNDLRVYVTTGNIRALTNIPGIGKKTAERIVVELRDKLTRSGFPIIPSSVSAENQTMSEALMALLALGYPRPVADRALARALQSFQGEIAGTSDLIKSALKVIPG